MHLLQALANVRLQLHLQQDFLHRVACNRYHLAVVHASDRRLLSYHRRQEAIAVYLEGMETWSGACTEGVVGFLSREHEHRDAAAQD